MKYSIITIGREHGSGGRTIAQMVADKLQIPLYDQNGEQRAIIVPDYGRPARITPPRK